MNCRFCDKYCYKLDQPTIEKIKIKIANTMPFQMNIAENLKNCKELNHEFLLTIEKKSHLEGVLILITIDNQSYTLMLINDIFYNIKLKLHNDLYSGTIFVGKLTQKHNRCVYFIDDIIYYCNIYYQSETLKKRLKIIYNIIKNKYKYDSHKAPFDVQLTGYFLYNHLPLIKKKCRILFKNDNSLYFLDYNLCDSGSSGNLGNLGNLGNSVQKLKIFKTKHVDVYKINNNDENNHYILAVTSIEISKKLNKLFDNVECSKHLELICEYNIYFNKWMITQ